MGFIEKYGTAIIALLIGGGFAFGGIASYSGLVGSSGSSNSNQQFNATLPNSTVLEGSMGLTSQQKVVLAARKDAVFVTGYYNTSKGRDSLQVLEEVQKGIGGSMYVNYMNATNSPPSIRLRSTPAVHIVGTVTRGNRLVPNQELIYNISEKKISSSACNYIRDLPDSGVVYCFS